MIAAGDDDPRSLQLPTVRARRVQMLDADHVAPLAQFVERIRERIHDRYPLPDYVPMFDPCDGGCAASLLVLLQSPGREAVKSGFVSRNNPDDTAETLLQAMKEADIPRKQTVLWNAVPWFVGCTRRGRAPNGEDRRQSLPALSELLVRLPDCRAALVLGRDARWCLNQAEAPRQLEVFDFPHPGPRLMRTNRQEFRRFVRLLRRIRRRVARP
jgi:uracil-DNA glycosylase